MARTTASTALVAAFASLWLGLLLPARAEASPTARLVYVRGAGAAACPDEDALKQRVAAHLGYDPFRPFVQNTLFVEVRRERGRWLGSVRVVDDAGIERGARKLEERGDNCSEMTSTLALSISIAIDPKSALSKPAPPPSPSRDAPADVAASASVPAPSTSSSPSDAAAPMVEEQRERAKPVRVGIALGPHAGFGVTPHATAGAQLSTELSWTNFSAALEFRADVQASQDFAPSGRLKTSLAGASLVPCLRWGWASTCGVAFIGRVRAETANVALPRSELFAFAAAGLRLAADIDLGAHVGLRPYAEVLGTLTPFVIEFETRRIERSSPISALVGASVTYFF